LLTKSQFQKQTSAMIDHRYHYPRTHYRRQTTNKRGLVRVTWPIFLDIAPNILGVGETRQFTCRELIDTEVY